MNKARKRQKEVVDLTEVRKKKQQLAPDNVIYVDFSRKGPEPPGGAAAKLPEAA